MNLDVEQLLRNLPKAEPMTAEELARFENFVDELLRQNKA